MTARFTGHIRLSGPVGRVFPLFSREGEKSRAEPLVARIDVACDDVSDGVTDVSTAYTYVGLSEEGNRAISLMTASEYETKMARWTTWLEGYLRSDARE